MITANETVEVFLSKYNGETINEVDDAQVEFFINDSLVETILNSKNGSYSPGIILHYGDRVDCCIAREGKEIIEAQDIIPEPPLFVEVEPVSFGGLNNEGKVFPAIDVTFPTDSNETDYFEILISTAAHGREAYIHTINDPVLLREGLPVALFSNEGITDSIYTIRINYDTGGYGPSYGNGLWWVHHEDVIVSVRKVSYHYYQYKKQYYLYQQGQDFDGLEIGNTAFPLYSNVENGDGIFAAYAEQTFYIKYESYVYKE